MPARTRLDQLILARGLATSRAQAQALLLAGRVRVGDGPGGRRDRKAGDLVPSDVAIALDAPQPYVSRGGEKLAGALDAFGVEPRGRTCLDVGASTGGFTDCLLQRGARHVYALDVGRGQLAEALRADPRVTSMERTHARRLDPADPEAIHLPEPITLAVADVSFISLTRILPGMAASVVRGGELVVLVKPQFESRPAEVPKGVVRDDAVRAAAVRRVATAATQLGLDVLGEVASGLPGPAGNVEFFLYLRQPGGPA